MEEFVELVYIFHSIDIFGHVRRGHIEAHVRRVNQMKDSLIFRARKVEEDQIKL
jgi:hypothetical protein